MTDWTPVGASHELQDDPADVRVAAARCARLAADLGTVRSRLDALDRCDDWYGRAIATYAAAHADVDHGLGRLVDAVQALRRALVAWAGELDDLRARAFEAQRRGQDAVEDLVVASAGMHGIERHRTTRELLGDDAPWIGPDWHLLSLAAEEDLVRARADFAQVVDDHAVAGNTAARRIGATWDPRLGAGTDLPAWIVAGLAGRVSVPVATPSLSAATLPPAELVARAIAEDDSVRLLDLLGRLRAKDANPAWAQQFVEALGPAGLVSVVDRLVEADDADALRVVADALAVLGPDQVARIVDQVALESHGMTDWLLVAAMRSVPPSEALVERALRIGYVAWHPDQADMLRRLVGDDPEGSVADAIQGHVVESLVARPGGHDLVQRLVADPVTRRGVNDGGARALRAHVVDHPDVLVLRTDRTDDSPELVADLELLARGASDHEFSTMLSVVAAAAFAPAMRRRDAAGRLDLDPTGELAAAARRVAELRSAADEVGHGDSWNAGRVAFAIAWAAVELVPYGSRIRDTLDGADLLFDAYARDDTVDRLAARDREVTDTYVVLLSAASAADPHLRTTLDREFAGLDPDRAEGRRALGDFQERAADESHPLHELHRELVTTSEAIVDRVRLERLADSSWPGSRTGSSGHRATTIPWGGRVRS